MEQKNRTEEAELLDITRLFHNFWFLLKRTFLLVLAAAVVMGAFTAIRVRRSYRPRYVSQAVLQVNSGYISTTDIYSSGVYYDNNAANQVVNTFQSILSTDAMAELLQQELGGSYAGYSVTADPIAESNLFTLRVSGADPQRAQEVAEAVIACYPRLAALVVGSARLEIVEPPTASDAPANSNNWKTAGLRRAMISGGILLLLVFVLAQLRRTAANLADMRQISSLHCLAMIPKTTVKRRKQSADRINILSGAADPYYTEAIATLRTRLLRRAQTEELHTLLVTSTAPGEGKSTIAANLALSLDKAGHSVILVDADLRSQSLHEFFHLPEDSQGLIDLLNQQELDPVSCLQRVRGTRLRVLSGEANVKAPSSMLNRQQIARIIKALEAEADFVILDTPPIGLLADAASFLRMVNGVLYVVRADYASRIRIADGLQAVAQSHTALLGYVFNDTDTTGQGYGSGGYAGYVGYGSYGGKSRYYQ